MNVVRRIAACAAIVAACAAPPSPSAVPPSAAPDPVSGELLVLAGDPGAETLTAIEAATGLARRIDQPFGGIRLLAAGWAPLVAATQAGRSVAVGRAVGTGVAWETIEVASGRGEVGGVAVSPDGAAIVATVVAPGERRPFEVVRLRLSDRVVDAVAVDEELDGSPVWIDAARVAVPTTGAENSRSFVIVDPATRAERTQPTQLADLSRSADGARFANGSAIFDPSVFTDPNSAPAIAKTGIEGYASAALDRSGKLLAVVLSDDDGEATAIVIHAEARGWNEVARFAVPGGAKRAFVTWIP